MDAARARSVAASALLHLEADSLLRRRFRQRWRVDDVHDALKNSDDGSVVHIEPILEFLLKRGQFAG